MSSRSILRVSAACAAFALFASTPAHAQLGGLRRAAQRAAGNAAVGQATSSATPQASAASRVNTGEVLEMTAPVLDRFQRALAAEAADRAQLAQRLAALKTPEQYSQCAMQWMTSAQGQAASRKMTAASTDQAAMTAAATEMQAALARICGTDPGERDRMRDDAQGHAAQAGLAAGGFSAREYAVIKERAVPFCRASAGTAEEGDVRLAGRGTNVFWVYTATEAAALRERCDVLMQALSQNS